MHIRTGLLSAIGLLGSMAIPAMAGGMYDFTSAPIFHDSSLSLGFVFSTNGPLTVRSLGYYDDSRDGFAAPHTVGIFNDNGILLTSTILGVGASASLDGWFRYQTVVPITLDPYNTYTLAATTGGNADAWAYGTTGESLTGLSVNASISIASDASRFLYQGDDTLRNPTGHFLYTLYAGPNLQFDEGNTSSLSAASVPEPGSLALALAGLALICGFARRRKAR